jgi:zinc protease
MRRLALALALSLASSCTPAQQGGGEVTPTLPGKDPLLTYGKQARPPQQPVAPQKPVASDPWAGKKDLIAADGEPAAQRVPLAAPQRFTLANGISVIAIPDPEAGVVAAHLVIPEAGGDSEQAELRGISDVTAAMLTKGTRRLPGDKLGAAASRVGASLAADADAEAGHLSCDAMAGDIGTCLELLSDVVMHPQLAAPALEEVKHDVIANLRQRHEDGQSLATLHVRNLLWGEGALRGAPATTRSIEALSVKTLSDWHAAYYVPNHAILVVAGAVDVAALKASLDTTLGRWPRLATAPALPAAASVPALPVGVKVRLVDRPDATSVTIMLARDGVAHGDADYLPTLLDSDALGGDGLSTRLAQLGKKLAGKLLGARAFIERARGKSAILISAVVKTGADVPAVLSGLIDTLKTFAADGPSAAELGRARMSVAGNYAFGYERPADIAAAIATAELHGLSDAWVRDFPATVAAVDPAQAKKAAAHFDPAGLVVVIVGRGAEIAPLLAKSGFKPERVAWTDEITAKDRELARAPRPGDDKKQAEGKKLLDAAIAARGGARLSRLKSVKASGKMVIHANGRDVPGTFERLYVAPDRQRFDMTIPGKGTATLVIAPDHAFVSFQDKINEVPASDRGSLDVVTLVDPERVLLSASDPGLRVMADLPQTIGGKSYDVVVAEAKDGKGEPITILLDGKNHLPFRVYYKLEGQDVFDEYGAYKAVSGVQMAHTLKTVNVVLGVPVEITYDKIELDTKIDEQRFATPAGATPPSK